MYLNKHGSKIHTSGLTQSLPQSRTPSCQDIKSLSLIRTDEVKNLKTLYDWKKIIPNAAYFVGEDKYLFGKLVAIVYEDPITEKISTVFIARHGENQYNSLTIDARSRYFPACENLLPEYRRSNVRRSLAITGLRAYANLDISLRNLLLELSSSEEENTFDWDETTAGDLASSMKLIVNKDPSQIGDKILDLGYLQQKFSNALMLDIIYVDSENEIDENNKLVFLLGEQLDQLFDPLTEYSPESTEKVYKVPTENHPKEEINDDDLTRSICEELVKVQTNFTKNLVQFLQNFVVPLRIKVLNNEIGNLTISKLNLIFPPTIDEITRINCIFLDSLKVAFPYGSYEVIKACGTTIPYFYKAYMRHEAATKTFTQQLGYFFENYETYLKDNHVDLTYFTKRKIDSLIHGSLNLIKLKLILNRLMENNQWTSKIKAKAEKYYKSSINTIDAFGRDKLKPYNNRVFTPTGKLLTELASGWPIELQYGWLTRRVVSIFGGKNLITNNHYNEDIIIIFSDHILFLTIDDKEYYKKHTKTETHSKMDFYKNNNSSYVKVHEPSIPDILMHSLINQIPLTNLPHLKVSGWADIGDIYPSTYNEGKMIQFFVVGSGIKTNGPRDLQNVDSIKKYQINDVNKLNNGLKIIDLVNKAKILNKSSPFHLFKTKNLGLSVYSTAHEKSVYVEEKSKSPFALFLNMKVTKSYLYQHNLYAGLGAKFIDSENIEIHGITKDGSTIEHVLPSTEFSTFLAEELSNLYSNFLSYKNNSMVTYLINANDKLADFLIHYVNKSNSTDSTGLLEEPEDSPKSTNANNINVDQINNKLPEKKKSVIKLLISPLKKKLSKQITEEVPVSTPSKPKSIENPEGKLNRKSKETLLSVLSVANESNTSTVIIKNTETKPPVVTPMKSTKIPVKTPTIDADAPKVITTSGKKKKGFFDKLFRRKQKNVEPQGSPVKIITNSPNDEDIAPINKETKIQRTLNKIFKSSLNISNDINQEKTSPVSLKQIEKKESTRLVRSSSRDTVCTFNTTMDNIINTPYATPSKPGKHTKHHSTFIEESPLIPVTISRSSNDYQGVKMSEFRSSATVNINPETDFIDNNSSTIRAVHDVKSQSSVTLSPAYKRSSLQESPIPSRVSMTIAMSPSRSKRNSRVLNETNNRDTSRSNSVKSRTTQRARSENGKENLEHLEEVTKLKLAKENYKHLLSIKNNKSEDPTAILAKDDFDFTFSVPNNTNSIKESIRNSLFVDDYSDVDDDDIKKNWVIARENSSLTNIEKVGSLASNNSMYKSTSRNWTLTRDNSSMNLSKHSFKKTESGLSIYNDFVDETVAPNWIIARDNSTLLNIPKDISSKMIGPERSISRSKNINLLPYQNQIRHSLNSLKLPNGDNLDDDQKLYALLLSKEKFGSDNSSPYVANEGHLSDDEGRFDDEDEGFDDFEEDVSEDSEEEGSPEEDEADDFITPDNIAEDEFEEIPFDKITNMPRQSSLLRNSLYSGHFPSAQDGSDPEDDFDEENFDQVHEGIIDEDLLDEEEDDDISFDEPKQHGLMSTLPTLSSFGEAQKTTNSEVQDEDIIQTFQDDKEYLKDIIDEEESNENSSEEGFDKADHSSHKRLSSKSNGFKRSFDNITG